MANAITNISLENLHNAIVAEIKRAFPNLATVEFYREENDRKQLPLPACLLELSEMDAAGDLDPGTEQLAVTARFEARFVIGFRTPKAKIEIRSLAAGFAAHLRSMLRWPDPLHPGKAVPTGPCEVTGCYPDDFDPALDKYEVWRVEWQQVLHLGDTVWTDDGTTPENPVYSWAPDIGAGNESSYEPV